MWEVVYHGTANECLMILHICEHETFCIVVKTFRIMAVFSLILSMTGKITFQTSKAILLHVEFSRILSNFTQ